MTPESLRRQFDVVADAPNGVQKLRELILQLAVRGKLVAQDPSDEPASVLLERIAGERERLVAEGKIRRERNLPEVEADELPFKMPEGWIQRRLGAVTSWPLTDGDWVESKDQDPAGAVRLIQLADVGEADYRDRSARFLTAETAKRLNCTVLEVDDVLIARLPNPLGRACVFPGERTPCVTVVDVAIARCGEAGPVPRYLMYAVNSGLVRKQIYSFGTGTTRFRVSTGNLSTVVLPLPPLAEQHRIVAKVDELMALCDELEARQQRRAEARTRLNRSALHHLTSASDDAELAAHWERLRENFHLIYDTPESVAELRQAVLQLAVRGKLVPQDPSDEPASVLLERIAAEKKRLFAEGKTGKPKALPPIGESEVPFDVPKTWNWTRIGEIADVLGGIQKSPKRAPIANHYPYLRVANVQRGTLLLSHIERFELGEGELDRWRLEPGDLLVVEGNGSASEIGRCARWNGELPDCVHQNHLIRVRPVQSHIGLFILSYLNSPDGMEEMRRLAVTTSGLFNLSVSKIVAITVPLPPLAEQHRIVAKVDELMALCDELESRLTIARESSVRLAAAVVHHLTAA